MEGREGRERGGNGTKLGKEEGGNEEREGTGKGYPLVFVYSSHYEILENTGLNVKNSQTG